MQNRLTLLGIVWTLAICVPAHAETTPAEPTEIYAINFPMGGVAVQPDGRIVVSCGISLFALDTTSGMINLIQDGAFRFHPDGSLDRTFRCNIVPANTTAPQYAHITSAPDGRMLLTGVFQAVDGKPRNGYAMILPNGKLDDSFEPWRGYSNPPARCGRVGVLYPAALLTNGCVAVPSFTIACRFNYLTTYLLDSSGAYVPRPGIDIISNDWPYAQMSLLFRDNGFGAQRSIDWHRNTRTTWTSWPQKNRNVGFPLWGEPPSAADVAPELASLFKEAPIELCRYATRLPDGGAILAVEGTNGSHLMRFDSTWQPDFSFNSSFEGKKHHGYSISGPPSFPVTNPVDVVVSSYSTMVLQPDGKLLLAGDFSKVNGEPFHGLARLLSDGSTDPAFHCVTGGDTRVMGVALQADGRILIVGFFSEVNGVKCPYFARLNPDGSLDTEFQKRFTTHDDLKAWRRVPVQMLSATTNPTVNTAVTTTMARATLIASKPQTVLINSLNLNDGVAVIQFQGNPLQTYILQTCEALNASAWSNSVTNQTDSAGTGIFRDEGAKSFPMRFYRVASPQ